MRRSSARHPVLRDAPDEQSDAPFRETDLPRGYPEVMYSFIHFRAKPPLSSTSASGHTTPSSRSHSCSSAVERNSTLSELDEMDELLEHRQPGGRRDEEEAGGDSESGDLLGGGQSGVGPGTTRGSKRPCKGKRRRYQSLVHGIEDEILDDPLHFSLEAAEAAYPQWLKQAPKDVVKLRVRLLNLLQEQLQGGRCTLQRGQSAAASIALQPDRER
mmetsp:Transcript_27578/g.74740  ORF Transcript_27578/g.74740 Transcript_27578/m.74740 type:complete len:215 (-) Transcript_27578:149-793(-)